MRILITGGAGFLGSHLCEYLLTKGHFVICLDNLITGSRENIAPFLTNPNFKFLEKDVESLIDLENEEINLIYHLASPASPNEDSLKSYHALSFQTMRVNTFGTWALCELALKKGAKLLFASTSEIYGDPMEHPQKESYRGNVSTTGPRSVYDEAKRFGETIVSTFVRIKGLDGRIIRIFNTYGPGMDLADGRAVVEFLTCALKGKELQVFGDGSQTRSFCYVDDLTSGIVKAMESDNTRNEVFNLGNPNETTILELAKMIQHKTQSQSEIIFKPLPQDDPLKRRPDITKARQILNWEPKIELNQGLEILIDYLKQKNQA